MGERFREAVECYDWTIEDHRLAARPVTMDVGVACLELGPVAERRLIARQVADALIQRADELMYEAKGTNPSRIGFARVRLGNGELIAVDFERARA